MKKITLLLLVCFPLLSVAQSWDFNNDNGGWSGDFGTVTAGATASTFTITGMANENPKFLSTTAGVVAPTNFYAVVTLKNNSNNGYMRVSYPKTTSGRIFKNQVISTNDTSFQTYVVDVSNNNHFVGTLDDIQLIFKVDASNNADGSGGTIEIDRIEFTDTLPILLRSDFTFDSDGDTEGWNGKSGLDLQVTGGNLVQDYTNGNANGQAKMAQELYAIDASANQYMHIVLQNATANDELRISYPDDMTGRVFKTTPVMANSTTSEIIDVDMTNALWTGNISDFQIQLRETASGATLNAGTVTVERIVFDNNATLSNESLVNLEFNLYPNPAKNSINIISNETIDNVSIYSVTGAKVYSQKPQGTSIDISNLNDGIYLVKMTAGDQSMVRKLIKN